jgi:hypothetical protein
MAGGFKVGATSQLPLIVLTQRRKPIEQPSSQATNHWISAFCFPLRFRTSSVRSLTFTLH